MVNPEAAIVQLLDNLFNPGELVKLGQQTFVITDTNDLCISIVPYEEFYKPPVVKPDPKQITYGPQKKGRKNKKDWR